MDTKVVKAVDGSLSDEDLRLACEVLRCGGLVAFPTETVYGLGGDATDAGASQKIYAAKGRPSDNPLIVHIARFEQLQTIVAEVPHTARLLAERFWPGPLTMILQKNARIPYETTGGLDTVAIRMPSHPVAMQLLQESDVMIAAPSANTSGRPSPTSAMHVLEDLDGKIDLLIDGGDVGIGIESTIVDLTEETPVVLRPGFITREMLSEVLGDVAMDPGLSSEQTNVRPKAPGMRYRHYAPRADLLLVEGNTDAVIAYIAAMTVKDEADGRTVGILATEETKDRYARGEVLSIGSRTDAASIAKHLYRVLREFDARGVDVIYSESFSSEGVGQAIMNRLLKAAGHRRITVEQEKD